MILAIGCFSNQESQLITPVSCYILLNQINLSLLHVHTAPQLPQAENQEKIGSYVVLLCLP